MIRSFFMPCRVLAPAMLGLPWAPTASAAILMSDVRDITIQQLFRDAPGTTLVNLVFTDGANASEDFVVAAAENLFQAQFGYTGLVFAFQESSYLPSQPGLGNSFQGLQFSAFSQANSTITESDFRNDDIANSRAIVRFSVDAPAQWTWDASIAGEQDGDVQNLYYFGILDPVTGDPFFEDVRTGFFGEDVSQSGALAPGEYELILTARAFSSRQLTAGSGAGAVLIDSGLFTITVDPPPADVVPEPASVAVWVAILACAAALRLPARKP